MSDVFDTLRAELADRYLLESELGRGAMGVVFKAQDLKHSRTVAVKVLRTELATPQFAERFFREIAIAARLSHPHILPLYDSGRTAACLFYVTPFVEGQSLRDSIRVQRQLPIDVAVHLASEVGDALDYAHRQGVVHRDVKPENVLISNGHAVVADFGIATAFSGQGAEAATALTMPGLVLGTPAYMSPEQIKGVPVDGRSDIYSLGCVLYELLAGQPPFSSTSVQANIAKHLSESPADVRTIRADVSEVLAAAIQRALAKAPADRFSTAAEFILALRAVGLPSSSRRARRLVRTTALVTALITLASLGVGVTYFGIPFKWVVTLSPLTGRATASPAGSASIRILEATPTPGTVFSSAQINQGVRVHVALEHNVTSTPSGRTATLSLLAEIACSPPSADRSRRNCWQSISSRDASSEPMQLAVEGTVRSRHVIDGRITLRVTVLFKDASGKSTMAGSSIIEYTARSN